MRYKKRPAQTDRSLCNYIRVIFTLLRLPVRRLKDADYLHITEIRETSGKHHEHELHILHPIFSISNVLFILCH